MKHIRLSIKIFARYAKSSGESSDRRPRRSIGSWRGEKVRYHITRTHSLFLIIQSRVGFLRERPSSCLLSFPMTRLPPAKKLLPITLKRTPVSYRARTRTTKTGASTPADSISSQCSSLDLPLELRLTIYQYALETGIQDEETRTSVLQIFRRHDDDLRPRSRKNRYKLLNFTEVLYALPDVQSDTC